MRTTLLLLVSGVVTLASCTGPRFGPGFSMADTAYFSDPPYITIRTDDYHLRWRYGTFGFYFQPSSKVINGQLVFALQGTSSSGSLSGHYGELPITDPQQIRALEHGGAFWLQPDGRLVRLEVRRM